MGKQMSQSTETNSFVALTKQIFSRLKNLLAYIQTRIYLDQTFSPLHVVKLNCAI